MKKICFVTTVYNTLNAFVLDTAKYLHEQGGFDITFISKYNEAFEKKLPSYIHYIPVKMKRGIDLGGYRAVKQLEKIFKEQQFDMVQYSTPNASFYASIAAKRAEIPVRLYAQWGILYTGYFGLKRKIFKMIEKTTCNNSTWIEPDSFGNLDFCHKEGLYDDSKSSVVWNGSAAGVNLEKYDVSQKDKWAKEIKEELYIPDNHFVIGFVGRVTRDKGLTELLVVLEGLKIIENDISVIIVGENNKKNSVNKVAYTKSLQNKNIVYTGRVNDVERYLSAMDVFVLPSYREGFGSVVIEAQAMAVPAIVTDIPGPREAIKIGETGFLIEKENVKALYEILLYAKNRVHDLPIMGSKGRKFIEDNFDSSKMHEMILKDRMRLLNLG